jgi:hypothetical protein
MRSNKIHNVDLFTQAANDHFSKHVKTQSKQALEIINKKVDWPQLVKPLERAFAKLKTGDSPAGRKPMDVVLIVKCFLLQHLYGLSDPRLEEEIADRRSFQMFLGLNSAEAIPDETTICRYRASFAQHGLDKTLFQAFHQQMASLGLLVGKGTIIDASPAVAGHKPRPKASVILMHDLPVARGVPSTATRDILVWMPIRTSSIPLSRDSPQPTCTTPASLISCSPAKSVRSMPIKDMPIKSAAPH